MSETAGAPVRKKSSGWVDEGAGENPDKDCEGKLGEKPGGPVPIDEQKAKKEEEQTQKREAEKQKKEQEKKRAEEDKRKKEEEEAKKAKYPKRLPGDPKRIFFKCDQDDDATDYTDDDEPDRHQNPAFYLACATVIGMFCFCTFIFAFIFGYGNMSNLDVWLATIIGGFICFIVPFFYYTCTSHHPSKCCGRLGDGFLGAWPFVMPGTAMFWLYATCGIAVKNVGGGPLSDKILIYCCVPLYMLGWVPCMLGLMYLQGNELEKEQEEKEALAAHRGKKAKRGAQVDLGRGRWKISFTVFRRLVIATVVACCVTSYAILPFFGLCWAIIAMMALWEIHWAIPSGILFGLIMTLIILKVCCPKVLRQMGYFIRGYYKMPIAGWAPRVSGSVLPKYDNSLTLDRRLDAHNGKVDRLEKLRSSGPDKAKAAEELMVVIRQERASIQQLGGEVVEEVIVKEPEARKEEPKQANPTPKEERHHTAIDVQSM